MSVEYLHNHFADTLGCSHDVGGIDGFVRGNQHKFLGAEKGCRLCGLKRTHDIVLDRLVGAVLHERHMLMGCRMVHNVRSVFFKNGIHSLGVAHGTD